MVTKRDDDQQGEYRAICLGKAGRQSFAIRETFIQISGENLDTVFQRAAGAIFNLQNLTCTDLKVRAMSMEGRADKV